jgi:gluconokinase
MGVSGCGKTAVGERLSQGLGLPFYDGDDFHPAENIAKMAQGIPLDDEDRRPWLRALNKLIQKHLAEGRSLVLACSALKQAYRDQLSQGNPNTLFIYLKGDFDLIYTRMQERAGHYMKAEMLRSQIEALEEPTGALVIDIHQDIDTINTQIMKSLPAILHGPNVQPTA